MRLLRLVLLLVIAALFGLLYLLSAGFRSEVNQALGILGRGDIAGLRDYILSFGLWAPIASCFLMVLQALVAPVPSFLITFANGLAFGVFWGWLLSRETVGVLPGKATGNQKAGQVQAAKW